MKFKLNIAVEFWSSQCLSDDNTVLAILIKSQRRSINPFPTSVSLNCFSLDDASLAWRPMDMLCRYSRGTWGNPLRRVAVSSTVRLRAHLPVTLRPRDTMSKEKLPGSSSSGTHRYDMIKVYLSWYVPACPSSSYPSSHPESVGHAATALRHFASPAKKSTQDEYDF
jgi:hypothetical protein